MQPVAPLIGLGAAVVVLAAAVVVPIATVDRTVDGAPVAGDRVAPTSAQSPPPTCGSDLLVGGSALTEPAAEAVAAAYSDDCATVTVTYTPLGTGAAIQDFTTGASAVAVADRVLSATEAAAATERCGVPPLQMPLVVQPVALPYHLSGGDELRLDAPTVAKIFDGRVTSWTDPAIAALNPGATLPQLAITPVHRSTDTGLTTVLQAYLTAAGGWTAGAGPTFAVPGGVGVPSDDALLSAVASTEGAIGYSSASAGPVARLGDTGPELSAIAAAMENALRPGTLTIEPADLYRVEPPAYPLVSVAYAVACPDYPEAETSTSVREFLLTSLTAQGSETTYLLPTGTWADRVRDALQ